MPGPDLVYSVAGLVVAALACWVGYAFVFAPPLIEKVTGREGGKEVSEK